MQGCRLWGKAFGKSAGEGEGVGALSLPLRSSGAPLAGAPWRPLGLGARAHCLNINTFVCNRGEGNGNPLQYSCLENPMGRGAWQAPVHGVARVGHILVTKPTICRI